MTATLRVLAGGSGWELVEAAAADVLALADYGLEPGSPALRRATVLWGCNVQLVDGGPARVILGARTADR